MNPEIGKIQTWDGKEKEMEKMEKKMEGKIRLRKKDPVQGLNDEQKVLVLAAKYIAANNEKRQAAGYSPSHRFHSVYCRIGGLSFYAAIRQFGLEETYKGLLETGELQSFPVKGGFLVGPRLTDEPPTKKAPKRAPTLEEFLGS